MMNTHSFSFSSKKYDFETEEDYKTKYNAQEAELTKQRQQISKYYQDSLNSVKDLDKNQEEEIDFLRMDDVRKKKKNNNQTFVSDTAADVESRKIRYPPYSPPILPYQSPIKTNSPSKRFQNSMDVLDKELKKQDYYNNKNLIDSDTEIFDFSDNVSSTDRV